MWCPKCKTEYTDGITVCADCGTTLIEKPETADFINVCEIRDEKTADEILEFLTYSEVKGAVKEEMEDGGEFQILVPEKAVKKAEKMVHGYLVAKAEEKEAAEQENHEEAEDASPDDIASEEGRLTENPLLVEEVDEDSKDLLYTSGKKDYEKKADKYTDLKFSGLTFILFGILGGGYLLLSKLEVIPISYNMFIFSVMSVMFAGFLIAGILSLKKAGQLKAMIPQEEEKIGEIKAWLKENVTEEMLDTWKDDSVSPSENDLLLAAHIQVMLRKQYPQEEKEFLNMLADEFYEETFLAE